MPHLFINSDRPLYDRPVSADIFFNGRLPRLLNIISRSLVEYVFINQAFCRGKYAAGSSSSALRRT